MQEIEQKIGSGYFFGSYIRNTHTIYGYDEREEAERKRKEKEMFEIIEDYIEQA